MALKKFLMTGVVATLLVACGDDSGSNSVTDSDEVSSSSVCKNCDGSSSSKAKSSSSSRKKGDAGTESGMTSSSAKSSSSSVAYVEPCRTNSVDTCEYGTLTDERDGQTYKTVTIGTQIWMAENLNYAYIGVPYKVTNKDNSYTSDSTSWCYKNDSTNCAKYGRLYTWAAAMDSVGTWSTNGKGCGDGKECSPTYPVRGICPEGWHLPDTTEWHTLFTAVGKSIAGKRLKSTSGWYSSGNGTDAYAFSALPAGNRHYDGDFDYKGFSAYFWSSSEFNSGNAYYMYLECNYDDAYLGGYGKRSGYSVRCLKDLQAE